MHVLYPCALPMCMNCRAALEAATSSPAAAHLTAKSLNAPPLPQKGGESNQVVDGSAASETSLAAKHVACMVSIVGSSAQACWLAVCEEESVQSAHLQALLDTFASDALFCQDKPSGLRQVHHQLECISAAAMCLPIAVTAVLQPVSGVFGVLSGRHIVFNRENAVTCGLTHTHAVISSFELCGCLLCSGLHCMENEGRCDIWFMTC